MRDPHPLPPGFLVELCLPTAIDRCKSGPAWVHEIKHDGYRMIARRNGNRGCSTRAAASIGPTATTALRSLRARSIVIDGEAVVCGPDGKSDIGKLHSGRA
jgi:bifunctional non-homologous end joining protein LigD